MPLVAGVDSATQSCKVVICDADSGAVVRDGQAPHPGGTEVGPEAWWRALGDAIDVAGGVDDVRALGIAAQQHGMVCLDEKGAVVRPALLWNDTRSAAAAEDLVRELGGGAVWAEAVGAVPVASFTVTKLRWLREHEPGSANRTAAVCLPHDYLTWRYIGGGEIDAVVTDRGDASGTGYWSPADESYRTDLVARALGEVPRLPRVLGPAEPAGETPGGITVSAGTGDNMGAALGLGLGPGDVVVSLGTSGTVFAVTGEPYADPTGTIAGFADATGAFLPLVCTLNAARVLDGAARMLRTDLAGLSDLALSVPSGADGLVLVPYLDGERTPNRPNATGALHGLRTATMTSAHLARAAVEGMLCGLADGLDALASRGVEIGRIILIGGAARSEAVRRIAPRVFARPVLVPPPGEYVAEGAARQAAWARAGGPHPPAWGRPGPRRFEADADIALRDRYAEARRHVLDRS